MVLEFGIDIGYSGTKAAAADVPLVQLASFDADIPGSKGDDLFKGKAEHLVQLTFNGSQVEKLVGEAALRTGSAKGMMGQVEKPDTTHDLLLFTAAYLLCAGSTHPTDQDEVDVVLGLPIDYLRHQRGAIKQRLERRPAWISVDGGAERCIVFRNVDVRPQGAGIMMSTDPSTFLAPDLPVNYVLVLDLGSYTINFLLFEFRAGESPQLVPDCYGTIEKGVSLVQQRMADAYLELTGKPLPSYMMADTWRHRQIYSGGKLIDLSEAIGQAAKAVADDIVSQLQSILKERMTYITSTIAGGGGALIMGDELRRMTMRTNGDVRLVFPHFVIVENPVYANAIGFLNACRSRKSRQA
jgi:plasmid segregation protein ParM